MLGSRLRAMSSVAASAARRLEGKVAIVTASTDGIGYSIAQKLARDGASVMVSSRKQANVDSAVGRLREEGVSVEGMVCHVGKGDHRKSLIEETVSKFGKLDILVSNAAVNPTFGPTLDTSESSWDKILDVNIKAAALLVKEAYPHLKATGNGSVVFVSSIGGYLPFQGLGPYSVSKTALLGLTKVLAGELACDNIRLWTNEALAAESLKYIPSEGLQLGEPDDCSGAVSFLCSDDAAYITGETIIMTGGMPSRL